MKVQFWSFDVIFAMVIFGVSLTLITYVWYNISNQYAIASGLGVASMQAQMRGMQESMLLPGAPSNWNSVLNVSNTLSWRNISVGLGTGGGSAISNSKVQSLFAFSSYNAMTYQATKSLLGVGYDYYIRISARNVSMVMGRNPIAYNAVTVQVSDMPVLIDGRLADLHMELWTNTTFGVG